MFKSALCPLIFTSLLCLSAAGQDTPLPPLPAELSEKNAAEGNHALAVEKNHALAEEGLSPAALEVKYNEWSDQPLTVWDSDKKTTVFTFEKPRFYRSTTFGLASARADEIKFADGAQRIKALITLAQAEGAKIKFGRPNKPINLENPAPEAFLEYPIKSGKSSKRTQSGNTYLPLDPKKIKVSVQKKALHTASNGTVDLVQFDYQVGDQTIRLFSNAATNGEVQAEHFKKYAQKDAVEKNETLWWHINGTSPMIDSHHDYLLRTEAEVDAITKFQVERGYFNKID